MAPRPPCPTCLGLWLLLAGTQARKTSARPVLTFTSPPRHMPLAPRRPPQRAPQATVSDYRGRNGTRQVARPGASASPQRDGSPGTPRQVAPAARVFHSPGTLGAARPSASLKRHTLGAPGTPRTCF